MTKAHSQQEIYDFIDSYIKFYPLAKSFQWQRLKGIFSQYSDSNFMTPPSLKYGHYSVRH